MKHLLIATAIVLLFISWAIWLLTRPVIYSEPTRLYAESDPTLPQMVPTIDRVVLPGQDKG